MVDLFWLSRQQNGKLILAVLGLNLLIDMSVSLRTQTRIFIHRRCYISSPLKFRRRTAKKKRAPPARGDTEGAKSFSRSIMNERSLGKRFLQGSCSQGKPFDKAMQHLGTRQKRFASQRGALIS